MRRLTGGAEVVQSGERAGRGDVKDGARAAGAACRSGAVEGAVGPQNQAAEGTSAVGGVEAVHGGQHALFSDLVNGSNVACAAITSSSPDVSVDALHEFAGRAGAIHAVEENDQFKRPGKGGACRRKADEGEAREVRAEDSHGVFLLGPQHHITPLAGGSRAQAAEEPVRILAPDELAGEALHAA